LDGPFPKLCPAVTLSHQESRHSAVALLMKAALIQVSDYRLLGASGFFFFSFFCNCIISPVNGNGNRFTSPSSYINCIKTLTLISKNKKEQIQQEVEIA
jgi:hypothetical protein